MFGLVTTSCQKWPSNSPLPGEKSSATTGFCKRLWCKDIFELGNPSFSWCKSQVRHRASGAPVEHLGEKSSIRSVVPSSRGKKERGLLYTVLLSAFLHALGAWVLEQYSLPWRVADLGVARGDIVGGVKVRLASESRVEVKPAINERVITLPELSGTLEAIASAKVKPRPIDTAGVGAVFPNADVSADEYLPITVLSTQPFPLEEIVVPSPDQLLLSGGNVAAVFVVLIDQFGIVREVFPDEQVDLTGLEGVVRDAFLGARFSPGQIDGRAVRSRIRIEVVFESILPGVIPAIAAGQGVP